MSGGGFGKYHAKKVNTEDGVFDSQKEYARWCVLKQLQADGIITNLERQKRYVLIPTQREDSRKGKRGAEIKGKVLERECTYTADFAYYDKKQGIYVVEDCKGFKTPEYLIKRKLMLYTYNIRIYET